MHACTHLLDVQRRAKREDARFTGFLRTIKGRCGPLGSQDCKAAYIAAPSAGRSQRATRPPACRRSPASQLMSTSQQDEQARRGTAAFLASQPSGCAQSPSSHTRCPQVLPSRRRFGRSSGSHVVGLEPGGQRRPEARLAPALDPAAPYVGAGRRRTRRTSHSTLAPGWRFLPQSACGLCGCTKTPSWRKNVLPGALICESRHRAPPKPSCVPASTLAACNPSPGPRTSSPHPSLPAPRFAPPLCRQCMLLLPIPAYTQRAWRRPPGCQPGAGGLLAGAKAAGGARRAQ